jgi:hypothetical protein
MKLYVFAAFLPAILVWFIVNRYKARLWVYLLSYTVFILIGLLIGQLDPRYDFVNLIVDKQRQFIGLAEFYDVNSGFHMEVLTYELWDVIRACPEALFNVFTKPWINEISSLLFIPAIVENLCILSLLIGAIMYKRGLSKKQWNFILFCLSFTVILYCVIGLTTPITGAIVRYKILENSLNCLQKTNAQNGSIHFYNRNKLRVRRSYSSLQIIKCLFKFYCAVSL